MCGSLAVLCDCTERYQVIKAGVLEQLVHRGPDGCKEVLLPCQFRKQLGMFGTVLQMRGACTEQPFTRESTGDKDSNYLLWNGNVFGGVQIGEGCNDTVKIYDELEMTSRAEPQAVLSLLSGIHGPWAFVYWQSSSNSLWFGRDVFGRRSLLWHVPESVEDEFSLSSAGCHGGKYSIPASYWSEVPASCVFRLHCGNHQEGVTYQDASNLKELNEQRTHLNVVVDITHSQLEVPFPSLNTHIPHMPGIPVHKLTKETAECSMAGGATPSGEFVVTTSSSPCSKRECGSDVKSVYCDEEEEEEEGCCVCRSQQCGVDLTQRLAQVLEDAVRIRVRNAPRVSAPLLADLGQSEMTVGVARVAVLFSGGVDSAVIAGLVDRCLPPSEEVDLVNVAFEMRSPDSEKPPSFQVPDRLSALECLKELNPNRKWNLVLVDVTLEELIKARSESISQLIYPLETVLDDSIGCAMWFGARAIGVLHGSSQHIPYRSQAKTLFVGIGADEQLAGYSRHRTRFMNEQWPGLLVELQKDIKRLARRNLGRDDRCIADHHRDGQFPFLDEEVVSFLQQLPITSKVDFSLPRGVGEKILLRQVASLLGCSSAAKLPKRAIQFGSRIAKLSGTSGGREEGASVSKRLVARASDH